MPDLFVAKINYPRNNTGDASSRAGSSAITGRKVSFLVPLLPNNSSCQQLWNQLCTTVQLPPCEIEKGSTFKLNAKLIWKLVALWSIVIMMPELFSATLLFLGKKNNFLLEKIRFGEKFYKNCLSWIHPWASSYTFLCKRSSTCSSALAKRKPKNFFLVILKHTKKYLVKEFWLYLERSLQLLAS